MMDSKFDYSTHESWQQEIRRWEAEGDVKELDSGHSVV